MFKIEWSKVWNHLTVKADRLSDDIFLYRDGPSEFRGYAVPVMYVEGMQTLGMDGVAP